MPGIPRPVPLALVGALLIAGCADSATDYPSLLPRPIERSADEPPAAEEPAAPAPADPAIEARVTALGADLDSGERAFDAALDWARTAADRAGSAGSESWLTAQQALTALDAARAPVGTALSELDEMRIAAAGRSEPVDTSRLDAAWARADALDRRQRDAVSDLSARLPTS